MLVIVNVVPSSPILVTLMMEAIRSSEVLVLTRGIRHNIPDDGIIHNHGREILNCYKINVTNSSSLSIIRGHKRVEVQIHAFLILTTR
jgi:hypothetical protein